MLKSLFAAAAIAVIAPQFVAGEARADNWFDFGFFQPHRYRTYYPGPDYLPVRRRGWVYADPAYYPPDPYGNQPFDESYYDPTSDRALFGPPPVPHKPAKKKTVHATPSAPAKAKTVAAAAAPATVDKTITTASLSAAASPVASTAMSCDKASKVVSDYGFSDVKPATCSGSTYAFNAIRDGKPYSVKLDAASGELTEVKKVP